MAYEASNADCYPNTTVLINKLNIRNENELKQAEKIITSAKYAQIVSEWKLDKPSFDMYAQIHKYIFEDLYSWAGCVRQIDISKKGTNFCEHESIVSIGNKIFDSLIKNNCMQGFSRRKFIKSIASLYSSLNILHPFREGNGRTERAFFKLLLDKSGCSINFDKCDNDLLMIATIQAAHGVNDNLINFFDKYVNISSPKYCIDDLANVAHIKYIEQQKHSHGQSRDRDDDLSPRR